LRFIVFGGHDSTSLLEFGPQEVSAMCVLRSTWSTYPYINPYPANVEYMVSF